MGQVVLGESAAKSTPYIELYFKIIGGENEGGEVRWTSYFTDKAASRTIEALQIAGWQGDDVGEFADGKLHGLDQNDVEIVVELEEYEKDDERKVAPRVQWVNRLSTTYLSVKNAMSKDAAAAFGDRMRGLVLKMKAKQEKQGDANGKPSDVPF